MTDNNNLTQPLKDLAISPEDILQHLPVSVVTIDAALHIQFYNPAFEKLCRDYLGYSGKDLTGKAISDLLPEIKGEHLIALKSFIEQQIPFSQTGVRFEYPFEWTTKNTFWDLNLVPFSPKDPSTKGLLILARDVTLRVNTDLALQQSEERLRRITDNLDIIVYRVGFKPAFHIDYVNAVIEKISGYPLEKFYTNPQLMTQIIHPEDRNLPNQYVSNKNRDSDTLCVRWIRKDGQVIWTEHQMFEIFDLNGDLIYVEGIARQVSVPEIRQDPL